MPVPTGMTKKWWLIMDLLQAEARKTLKRLIKNCSKK